MKQSAIKMNSSTRLDKPELCIRIVVCDHYLARPTPGIDVIYSEFRGADIKQVPILRVFGSTPSGHKACLHIHGVFPYFYIPCPSPSPEPQLLYQIAGSLDKALNIALKQATSANQHVYKISLVKGLPFYGFHDKDHLYLKVFLYSPSLIKKAVELCSNGAILGQPFQPHESHLNFTLQFFIDFNLFGMSNIELQKVLYRKSGCSQNSNDPLDCNDDVGLKPESVCHYEADCLASHIINRQRVGRGDGIENPGLEEVWQQEMDRRKELNVSMASKSLSQGRLNSDETESHYKFEQMFLVKMSNLIEKPVPTGVTDVTYYPAESKEGSQFIDAVDVSVHVPDTTLGMSLSESIRRSADETLTEFLDETIVDETLNSSMHYSQVLLNTEDFELIDLLQDMDEQPVEGDSIIATPATNDEEEPDFDDADYSQAFNDTTICLDTYDTKNDMEENSPNWNDSFWDGANIPQLDGTCDDDHVKKVRKRKMRPFKLGLSRPKSKKSNSNKQNAEIDSKSETSEVDEINESRETITNISDTHPRAVVKKEQESVLKDSHNDFDVVIKNETVTNLVNSMSTKVSEDKGPAEIYDLRNNFVPQAGPSNIKPECCVTKDETLNSSLDTSPEEENLGIMSFYNKSNLCDITFDSPNEQSEIQDSDEIENSIENDSVNADIKVNIVKSPVNCDSRIVITPKIRPPSKNYVESTLQKYNIPQVRNPQPYFSDHKDVGDKIELGHVVLKPNSRLARDQKPFEKVLDTVTIEEWRQLLFLQTNETADGCVKPEALKSLLAGNKQYILQPLRKPPTKYEVVQWIQNQNVHEAKDTKEEIKQIVDDLDSSQAIGLNEDEINSSISLETSQVNVQDANCSLQVSMQTDGSFLCFGAEGQKETSSIEAVAVDTDFLTVMLTEVVTSVRGDLNPDPLMDAIQAVFITVKNDCPPNHFLTKLSTELYVVDPSKSYLDKCVFDIKIIYVQDEFEIIDKVIQLVKQHDPDIMCGYEIEMNSWGYIMERAQVLGLEVVQEISRITEKNRQKRWRGEENDFEGRVIGRIMFNVWRLFRHELALSSYSFENCMFVILNERVPKYSCAELWNWWREESRMLRWIPVEYFLTRLNGTVRMLDKLDFINRTSELARLFGLQWWEVLSRGSQFRVESLMLRSARPLNLIALSPTIKQKAAMRAPECLPLIFEPESRFYSDPVIVLDFQSLYPSMMIAYNYCFSTCIGRVQNINGDAAYEFGAWRLRIPKSKLEALVKNGHVHWSPVGAGFVKSSVRRGVLPALLRRILAARQAVKKGMKLQTDEAVKKAMHSRQLGLKLIANVTYGYTAANFSGRMPCVEVGDSVVAKGRETLERAIKLVNNNAQWNVKVIYGDTDSMFVLVPGTTREQAFAIGQQIADAVTADNPPPVALKLEKVYQPCILQTKKRYVGFMYESADQVKPVYEAKGIETVRRDGCPAAVKLLQRSLCELFESGDMSRVKHIFMDTMSKLINGTMPLQELFFTREYHGASGYKPGAHAPPCEIAKRMSSRDRRAAPRPGWRVCWLVCAGAPSAPLVQLSRAPHELRAGAAPHVAYYALRALAPPMQRCFSLLGHDVTKWWSELNYTRDASARHTVSGIARYMWRERCIVCSARGSRAVCTACAAEPSRAAANIMCRGTNARMLAEYCDLVCKSCCGNGQYKRCENYECPVIWRRLTAEQKLNEMQDVVSHLPPQFNNEVIEF